MKPFALSRRYGIYAALLFVFLFLFPFPSGGNKFLWKHVFDAGHFAMFFLLCVGIYLWLRQQATPAKEIIRSLFFSTLVAASIEIIQPLTGRSASFVDLLNGFLGALTASYLLAVFERVGLRYTIPRALLLGILVQAVVLIPSYQAWRALEIRDQHFPQLGYFDKPQSLSVWRSMNSKNNPTPAKTRLVLLPGEHPSPALWVSSFQDTWSGVYYDGGAQDWSAYRFLVFETFNPQDEALEISLRVDDTEDCQKYANRFNRTIRIAPGHDVQRLDLDDIRRGPESRELNLREIRFLYVFRNKDAKSTQFALNDVRLE